MPQVSVIIAAHNAEDHIAASIRSILRQTEAALEIVVVDDASSDGTSAAVAEIRDSRVHLLKNESKMGAGFSRNRAVAASSGELLAIQDADDVALPYRIAHLTNVMESNPALVVVSGQCIALSPSGRYWQQPEYPTDSAKIASELEAGRMSICHPASIIRRSAFESVGGYDVSYPKAQDFELFRRLTQVGRMVSSQEYVLIYRHSVFISWNYWATTRAADRRITGEEPPTNAYLVARYAAANARRSIRFTRSTIVAGKIARVHMEGKSLG
jgi:glycosyltransferase involved in cell wall biosynthesis